MIDWHKSSCRRPDVIFTGFGSPTCLSCGEVGIIDETALPKAARRLPELPQRAGFDLVWPSSLQLIDDAPHNHSSIEQTRLARPASISAGERAVLDATLAATAPIGTHTTSPSLYKPLCFRTKNGQPKQEIRLLRLRPGEYHDPIGCTLRNVDLSAMPHYEALSYTWADHNGDSSLSQPIYVGDHHHILLITVNCANALRRLRSSNYDRDLWIDAICIDQNNTEERSHQVGFMQNIYVAARRVLVYIGENPDDHQPETRSPWRFETEGNTPNNTLDLSTALINEPYFTRVWVIQELAARPHSAWILYGSKGAQWKDCSSFIDSYHRRSTLHERHPWLRFVIQPRQRDLNELGGLLLATDYCQATDPRDKVFALLGLFPGSNNAKLIPDYHLSFSQVASGITAFLFGHQSPLWSRLFVRASRHSLPDTPTWAVDWSKQINVKRDISSWDIPAPVPSDAAARFSKSGALVLKGIPVLSLSDCTIPTEVAEDFPGVIESICYETNCPIDEREAELQTSRWANNGDKLYAIDGLYDHMLILRPLECTNKQSFVGICGYVNTEFFAGLIHLLDRKRVLLLSTWNETLDHWTEDWLKPQTWNDVKDVCRLIRTHWGLEKRTSGSQPWIERVREGTHFDSWTNWSEWEEAIPSVPYASESTARKSPLLDLTKALFRLRRTQLPREPTLKDNYTLRVKPKFPDGQALQEVNFADFLITACWDFGETGDFGEMEILMGERRDIKRKHPWHPGYFTSSTAENFWERMRLMLRSEISYQTAGFKSAAQFFWRLIGQKVSLASGDFDALMRYYESYGLRPLRSSSRSDGIHAVTLQWIRNSMEIAFERHQMYNLDWLTNKDFPKTWAHNFCEIWEVLSRQPGVLPQEPPEEGVVNEGLDEALDDEGLTSEQDFKERAWRTLLVLVYETEGHLLALEEPFTAKSNVATCANKTEEMKWEDVYIV